MMIAQWIFKEPMSLFAKLFLCFNLTASASVYTSLAGFVQRAAESREFAIHKFSLEPWMASSVH